MAVKDIERPEFGEVLRRHRRARGLTQEALAERARMSRDAISALERSRRRTPRPDTVALLADALELADPERASFASAARRFGLPTDEQGEVTSPHNLPAPPTPLIGRAADVERALDMLRRDEVRLLTLMGPAGVGKTRLALSIAHDLVCDFDAGVFLVLLASITDTQGVVTAIARTLGLREHEGKTLAGTVYEYLRDKKLLLVLDNFEHLASTAPLLAELLAACPRVKLLVTSRAAVHVRGERQIDVPPLALPALDGNPTPEDLSKVPAVELFLQRAEAAAPEFKLTPTNASDIVAICRRLDGLPLALELAAARTRVLSPAALLARLERPLPVLVDGALDLPERQKTMRHTIGWSYDLLDEPQQKLFRRLAPFAGGFTMDAAQVVCNVDGDLGTDVLLGVASLVDQSLLLRSAAIEDEPRFRMLHTIREYAIERLRESSEAESIYERARDVLPRARRLDRPPPDGSRSEPVACAARAGLRKPRRRPQLVYAVKPDGARHEVRYRPVAVLVAPGYVRRGSRAPGGGRGAAGRAGQRACTRGSAVEDGRLRPTAG